ncbi:MAG: hypothetical protein U5L74_13540 [Ideonella sp.]|nr:hypothetical protein [Ideonella sp.]
MLLSGTVYHFVFLKAAREGWPVVSQLVKLVVRDEFAQRDRFMRENLDAMASRVGEMQARMVRLEAMGDRVTGLAGVKPDELKATAAQRRRQGPDGRRWWPVRAAVATAPSLEQLNADAWPALDEAADQQHRPVHPGRVAPVRETACRR